MKLKKSLLFLIAAFTLSAAIISCAPKTSEKTVESNVKYYRHLQFSETSYDLEKGLRELTAEEAQTINNYQFTYDESGRLTEIKYGRGDVMLSYGSMRGAAKITYTYSGNKQIKHFFNEKGEQIDSQGAYAAEYTLNDDGTRAALAFFDKEGNTVENRNNINRYTWKTLPDGLLQEIRYNLANESVVMNPFCPFYELRFKYDEKGFTTRMMNFEADTMYNCTAENCGDIGVSYFEFKNSPQGEVLSFSVHNTVGQLSNLFWGWAKRINQIDENGYNIETAVFDQDDEYLSGKKCSGN